MLTINNTLDGYLKDVEIKGNTIQSASNLADIRSVGDKVEGQELYEIPVLSCGKNLFDKENFSESTKVTKKINLLPNTTYYIYTSNPMANGALAWLHEYNANGDKITNGLSIWQSGKFTTKDETVNVHFNSSVDFIDTFVLSTEPITEYEPYQEDKLTILSPVQIEKVGDVRDRIIEKDGVWGVEKNVGKFDDFLNCNLSVWASQNTDTGVAFYITSDLHNQNVNNKIVSNKFLNDDPAINKNNFIGDSYRGYIFRGRIPKDGLSSENATSVKEYLHSIGAYVKYIVAQPQFIPLPHDQQVKLRTFANKTNISFGCEIEGTIKAQVPKSLGATVNTHTEQINNLNKELDRVKKLEESTVSTVTTESDFTTVEATSNGYFEDVKLEGRTLVNLANKDQRVAMATNTTFFFSGYIEKTIIKPSTKYVIVLHNISDKVTSVYFQYAKVTKTAISNNFAIFTTLDDLSSLPTMTRIHFYTNESCDVSEFSDVKYSLFECSDIIQNPPSYFEGLKSVGQETDEIVVSSVNENLLNDGSIMTDTMVNSIGALSTDVGSTIISNFRVCANIEYFFDGINVNRRTIYKYDKNGTYLGYEDLSSNSFIIKDSNIAYVHLKIGYYPSNSSLISNVYLGIHPFDRAITHQSDKKRLLYYNEETQTWEKPILREWDSIEKHSNGKYYYHQRSGEVVLNGSESGWIANSNVNGVYRYELKLNPTGLKLGKIISNKFIWENNGLDENDAWLHGETGALCIRSLIDNVNDFKQWLQTNNVTAVYQLEQEKVYECTNIDLITYANETNYIVECGAIVPKTTLKVHNNISNVVSLLQKKVSLLESNMTKYMITQNRMQLASTYSTDSVTFKVDYALCSEEVEYNEDLYNLILNNILVGKDNYDYDHMFNIIMDYASWSQISWEQFDILVGLMDMQHNPPVEELPTEDIIEEDIIENEETPVE